MKASIPKCLKDDVPLFLSDSSKYQTVVAKVLQELMIKQKKCGVYVALNKPYEKLNKFFKSKKINTNNLFFIDTSNSASKARNVVNVPPEHLTKIEIAIMKLLKMKDIDFVIFDTIDTFLIYNNRKTLEKFFRSVTTKTRRMGKKCVLIGIKDSLVEHSLHTSIERMSDDTMDLAPKISAKKRFEKTFLKL